MNENKKYIIGIDGGGTRTRAILVNDSGVVLERAECGGTNVQVVGVDEAAASIQKLVNSLLRNRDVKKPQYLYAGIAGAGRETDRVRLEDALKDKHIADVVTVDSDASIALAGAFIDEPGIIIIAGTGSICYGRNRDGRVERSGGWGYLLGDEGSAYFLGKEASIAALKDLDGRGRPTILRRLVEQHFKLKNIQEIIPRVYSEQIGKNEIADLARMVCDAARTGDVVAEEIVQRAGTELGLMAEAVIKKLNVPDHKIKIALIGGLSERSDQLVPHIASVLANTSVEIEFIISQFPATVGAVFLALNKAGQKITAQFIENLT